MPHHRVIHHAYTMPDLPVVFWFLLVAFAGWMNE
jgi:hypothetical protein